MDVRGPAGLVAEAAPYELDEFQRTFLFSWSETIYGGSNEIQKNIIGERVLGLPPSPRETSDDRRHDGPGPSPGGTRPADREGRGGDGRRRDRHRLRHGQALYRGGATVVVSDAHERRLAEAADALAGLPERAGVRPLAVPCNVTDEAQVQGLYDAAVAEHGRFDVAVNNAGLGGQVDVVDMTDEQWDLVLDVP